MQRLACIHTQSAERSQYTMCEKEIFEGDMLPVAKEHTSRKTHTQRHTPTHDALSILKKAEQSHACEPSLNQSLSSSKKKKETAVTFQILLSDSVSVCVCLCLSWMYECLYALFVCIEGKRYCLKYYFRTMCVSLCVCLFWMDECAYALFVCIEGKQALFKNNIVSLFFFLQDLGKLYPSVN